VERRVGGTTSVDVDDERRRRRATSSDTRCRSRDKYDGARPFKQRKTSTDTSGKSLELCSICAWKIFVDLKNCFICMMLYFLGCWKIHSCCDGHFVDWNPSVS